VLAFLVQDTIPTLDRECGRFRKVSAGVMPSINYAHCLYPSVYPTLSSQERDHKEHLHRFTSRESRYPDGWDLNVLCQLSSIATEVMPHGPIDFGPTGSEQTH
jgi:hypothetical protein